MQLIKLSANQKSFHTIDFKTNKVNIICGSKSEPEDTATDKTFNGVGKSLTQRIINFCLGSSRIPTFEEKLPDWEFTLEFQIGTEKHVIRRGTNKQTKVIFNSKEITVTKYNKILGDLLFHNTEGMGELSHRALINRFLRVDKKSCQEWDEYDHDKTAYTRLLRIGHLLGLDFKVIEQKKELRSESEKIKGDLERLEKDEVFKKYFSQEEDIEIEIDDYRERVIQLGANLKKVKIAEDYRDVEREANRLSELKHTNNNRKILIENKINTISKALKIKTGVSSDTVSKMYKKASVEVPEMVKKTLSDVTKFHEHIITGRLKRLLNEKDSLRSELVSMESELRENDTQLNEKMKYLSAHGAMDEYGALRDQLEDLKSHLDRLKIFKKIIEEYESKLLSKKTELDEQNKYARQYLQEYAPIREENNAMFRSFSKGFYPEYTAGISVKGNFGENQTQFDIDATIDYDDSDGIGEIKIICFDLTVLIKAHNHSVHFLFHDSRLFSDVDPRQIVTLLKLMDELCQKYGVQYIMTVNQNTLDSIESGRYLTAQEYKEYVTDNVILTLTDESEKTKLLGENVKINLDKKK
ncbi:MAG: hypothetical protein COA96_15010 [SAR86 cluster bacterium]|uniref:DUF2326 domain-containing protein n=1 Tax=SAR86 cluster bacterium TaxID=2030880 RepID=A0A2A5ATD0_9GAMM|nr:MAG: hypothetical protein COA96_15010 [SAR86 cluster bacterium]